MPIDRTIAQTTLDTVQEISQGAFRKAIAIGELDEWTNQGNSLPGESSISFLSFKDVSEAALAVHRPEVVYSPVLAKDFDCIDLASLLHNIGFQGTYRAVGNGLPKPELIEREVRQMCRRIKFEIIDF